MKRETEGRKRLVAAFLKNNDKTENRPIRTFRTGMMDRRDQTKEERMGDVLASEGFEGRGKLRKASGSR